MPQDRVPCDAQGLLGRGRQGHSEGSYRVCVCVRVCMHVRWQVCRHNCMRARARVCVTTDLHEDGACKQPCPHLVQRHLRPVC